MQSKYFDRAIGSLKASITPAVNAKLARVAAGVPGLGAASRVLDAGAGEGALIPHLQVSMCSICSNSHLFTLPGIRLASIPCLPGN
jgi:hypothetical protein